MDFEMFLFLAIGAVVLAPLSILVLGVMVFGLRQRVAVLEAALAEGRASPASQAEASDVAPGPAGVTPQAGDAPIDPAAAQELPAGPPRSAVRPPPVPARAAPAAPVVRSGPSRATLAYDWLRQNWVYAVSAASLALAGVFLVQYGVEAGLLPPAARVIAGALFGGALIAGGEAIRRRLGADGAAAFLPEVFSGAGVVSLFASVVAARLMYGLVGAELAFAMLLAVAAGAVLLGWRNGPMLVAVGLVGAALAPFLAGGQGAAVPWLYGHYALVAALGLAVDAFRRWGWVSVLALVLGHGGGWLMMAGGAGDAGWSVFLAAMAVLATILPGKALWPEHPGPCTSLALLHGKGIGAASPQVRLAFGALAFSAAGLVFQAAGPAAEALLAMVLLGGLSLLYLTWGSRAPGLTDLPFLPALGGLAALALAGLDGWPIAAEFAAQAIALRLPESAPPWTVSGLLAGAALISAGFAWRALAMGPGGAVALGFGLGAVLSAPLAAALFEMTWAPAPVLGAFSWALHAIALAGGMTWLASRFAAADAPDLRRTAHAVLAALSLVALALFVLTTKAALTLALSVLVVAAAALDRRFRLPEMAVFIQLGLLVLVWRLLVDPGLDWAMEVAVWQVVVAFGGAAAGAGAAWWLLAPVGRPATQAAASAAALVFAAMLVNVLAGRAMGDLLPQSHWGRSVQAMPWLLVALSQLWVALRMPAAEPKPDRGSAGIARTGRLVLAALAGAGATFGLLAAVTGANPLFSPSPFFEPGLVLGPPILDSLMLAYVLPGALLIWVAGKLPLPPEPAQGKGAAPWRALAVGMRLGGAALVVLYVGLEIRRFWQGDFLGSGQVAQGELYAYTVAMLLSGLVMLWQSHARRAAGLRRLAMGVIAVTVAKVFLIDAAGLTGLMRVASFLGLGLALAGLAWLNRWASGAGMEEPPPGSPPGSTPDRGA